MRAAELNADYQLRLIQVSPACPLIREQMHILEF